VALAARMDPEFASLAKNLVIMGGYVGLNMLEATGSIMQADYQSDVSELPHEVTELLTISRST
jgi:Inosine-uridine nucleoside N-ribohydrolase